MGSEWVADVCNAGIKDDEILEDWSKSWLASVYKGKRVALKCRSYRGIRMFVHVVKISERVIKVRVGDKVKFNNMQFGFMGG